MLQAIATGFLVTVALMTAGCQGATDLAITDANGARESDQAVFSGPTGQIDAGGGIRWQFVALSDDEHMKSWSPDGTPLKEWVVPQMQKIIIALGYPFAYIHNGRAFVVRIEGDWKEEDLSVGFRVNGSSVFSATFIYPGDRRIFEGGRVVGYSDPFQLAELQYGPISARSVDVDISVVGGPWQTASAYRADGLKLRLSSGAPIKDFILHDLELSKYSQKHDPQCYVSMAFPDALSETAHRLIALDQRGNQYKGKGLTKKVNAKTSTEFWFDVLPSKIVSFKLQYREFKKWESFKGVRWNPNETDDSAQHNLDPLAH